MPLPYEQLTQILGIEASDYPPEHETTPEFMNQKFNELLVNDKELLKQINDLIEKHNYAVTLLNGYYGTVNVTRCAEIVTIKVVTLTPPTSCAKWQIFGYIPNDCYPTDNLLLTMSTDTGVSIPIYVTTSGELKFAGVTPISGLTYKLTQTYIRKDY